MEENLESNIEVNNDITKNINKPSSAEIKESTSEKSINMDKDSSKIQNNSASTVEIKNENDLPATNINGFFFSSHEIFEIFCNFSNESTE